MLSTYCRGSLMWPHGPPPDLTHVPTSAGPTNPYVSVCGRIGLDIARMFLSTLLSFYKSNPPPYFRCLHLVVHSWTQASSCVITAFMWTIIWKGMGIPESLSHDTANSCQIPPSNMSTVVAKAAPRPNHHHHHHHHHRSTREVKEKRLFLFLQ